jgi:hypothetical protein
MRRTGTRSIFLGDNDAETPRRRYLKTSMEGLAKDLSILTGTQVRWMEDPHDPCCAMYGEHGRFVVNGGPAYEWGELLADGTYSFIKANEQNLPQPLRQEGESSCEGKENSPIREKDGQGIENS